MDCIESSNRARPNPVSVWYSMFAVPPPKPGGKHQTGGGCVFESADVGHRVFGQGDTGYARRVGETLRKNHDDGVVCEVVGTCSINLVCLCTVFLGQCLHRLLVVSLGLIHDFRVREAKEIDGRAVACGIAFGVPELRCIAPRFRPLISPCTRYAERPRERAQQRDAHCGCNDTGDIADNCFHVAERGATNGTE